MAVVQADEHGGIDGQVGLLDGDDDGLAGLWIWRCAPLAHKHQAPVARPGRVEHQVRGQRWQVARLGQGRRWALPLAWARWPGLLIPPADGGGQAQGDAHGAGDWAGQVGGLLKAGDSAQLAITVGLLVAHAQRIGRQTLGLLHVIAGAGA